MVVECTPNLTRVVIKHTTGLIDKQVLQAMTIVDRTWFFINLVMSVDNQLLP